MSYFRHTNHVDMNILSSLVALVPADKQIKFAANLLGKDLMRGPWWLRSLQWFVKSVRRWDSTITWYLMLTKLQRGFAEDVVRDFATHIRHGKDLSDSRSIGGLNQQEVEITVQLLRHLLQGTELPPGYAAALWAQ